MNYISRFFATHMLFSLIILLSGCSKESEMWLYNFSGVPVVVIYSGKQVTLEDKKFSQLYDWGTKKNTLDPFNLKVDFGESASCYFLQRITVGGYGQYDESNNLVFRFKLDKDKKIHVYKIKDEDEFEPRNVVGDQPKGYPVFPGACH
ncbi:MAG: hypothetical protein O7D86_09930 [Proteobacteria bacterium]|nr:hypothetical protein [Pseudomonadota bacterium]